MIELVALYALYGGSLPMAKYLLGFCPPLLLAALRMIFAGGVLSGFYYYRNRKFPFDRQHISLYARAALFSSYARYMLRSIGLAYMPAGKVALMLNASPFCAALFSYYLFNEKLTRKQMIALTVGFIGLIPLLLIKSGPEAPLKEFFFVSWPELLVIVGIVLCCYGTCALRELVREHNQPAYCVNGITNLVGGLIALPTVWLFERHAHITEPGHFFLMLAVLTFASNVICQNIYVHLLKKYSVTFMSFSDFLSPIFTIFYSWLFLHEKVRINYFISGAIIFGALYVYYQDELKSNAITS